MRSIAMCLFLLALVANAPDALAQSQAKQPAEKRTDSVALANSDEVEELRSEVAAQRQMIEDLQSSLQRFVPPAPARNADWQTAAAQGRLVPAAVAQGSALAENKPAEKKPASQNFEISAGKAKIQFYGHGHVSYDYVDNGITPAMTLNQYTANPITGLTATDILARSNNGWLGQISSNLSRFGIRGSRPLNDYMTGIFQIESEVSFTMNPGTTSDGQSKFSIGSRDSFVGLEGPWGAVKIGRENAPYKKDSSPLDPFIETIGDSRSIMGNSGGDNRGEFMTRIGHAIWYESPKFPGMMKPFSFSVLFSPGQNRSLDNSGYARGEPNCSGGNGVFTLSFANRGETAEGADFNSLLPAPDTFPCNDGSWGNVISAEANYKGHGLYVFGAYERHSDVNRLTDLVGVQDEYAYKGGIQYTLKATGTTGNFIYENLRRNGTDPLLNERSRPTATWAAITQKLGKYDDVSVGWAYAGNTPGDPGLMARPNNISNLYDIGIRHHFTPKMTTYFVFARQANHVDAHYDLGAVGHDVVIDKKDFLGTGFPGTRLQGVSGGMIYDF